jgi:hypothetical protein
VICRFPYHAVLGAMLLPVHVFADDPRDKQGVAIQALTDRIDRHIAAGWRDHKVKPTRFAEDGAFLRRVYLDLAGRIPLITEARDYREDPSPRKRQELVNRLLEGSHYPRHFAVTWRRLLLPQQNVPPFSTAGLESWLQQHFRQNVSFDRLARAILTAPLSTRDADLGVYYQVNEYKPENLAASSSRLFLGMRLECAQCHDHPFAKYTRKQFWEFAAFFADVVPPGQTRGTKRNRPGDLPIPGTNKVVQARAPGAADPAVIGPQEDPRVALADWMVREDNPFFARAMVNQLWSHFFGVGLVEPPDEISEENLPSHPELLDDLARAFVTQGYDVRFLIRAITASKAYQLASRVTEPGQDNLRLYTRMPVRALTAEQLFESLMQISGKAPRGLQGDFALQTEFLARFSNQERPPDAAASILQALNLMNGKLMADVTNPETNRALRTLTAAGERTTSQRIEELYLMVLTRLPRPEETARLVKYVEEGGPRRDSKKALGDILWVLLNSHEFCLNH